MVLVVDGDYANYDHKTLDGTLTITKRENPFEIKLIGRSAKNSHTVARSIR